jgi:hypothetical protein
MLTKRHLEPERMDDPAVDPAELDRALTFLRSLNRRLGGVSGALTPLKRWTAAWPREAEIRILDIATGAADIPLAIAAWAQRTGRGGRVRITAIDLHETTLAIAQRHVGRHPDIELLRTDARRLMEQFEPDSFDFVHAGLFLHHLPDIEAVTVLRIMDRLGRHGLIWNDLVRSPLSKLAVRLLSFAPWIPRIARHDALVSVRAGFTRAEALDLAQRAGWGTCGGGWGNLRYSRRFLYRFLLTSEKRNSIAQKPRDGRADRRSKHE